MVQERGHEVLTVSACASAVNNVKTTLRALAWSGLPCRAPGVTWASLAQSPLEIRSGFSSPPAQHPLGSLQSPHPILVTPV